MAGYQASGVKKEGTGGGGGAGGVGGGEEKGVSEHQSQKLSLPDAEGILSVSSDSRDSKSVSVDAGNRGREGVREREDEIKNARSCQTPNGHARRVMRGGIPRPEKRADDSSGGKERGGEGGKREGHGGSASHVSSSSSEGGKKRRGSLDSSTLPPGLCALAENLPGKRQRRSSFGGREWEWVMDEEWDSWEQQGEWWVDEWFLEGGMRGAGEGEWGGGDSNSSGRQRRWSTGNAVCVKEGTGGGKGGGKGEGNHLLKIGSKGGKAASRWCKAAGHGGGRGVGLKSVEAAASRLVLWPEERVEEEAEEEGDEEVGPDGQVCGNGTVLKSNALPEQGSLPPMQVYSRRRGDGSGAATACGGAGGKMEEGGPGENKKTTSSSVRGQDDSSDEEKGVGMRDGEEDKREEVEREGGDGDVDAEGLVGVCMRCKEGGFLM